MLQTMPVEPQTRTMLEQIALLGSPKAHDQSPAEARLAYDAFGAMSPRPDDVVVTDLTVPTETGELRARRYLPPSSDEPVPGLVHFHGGGCVIGSIESHDATCGFLASVGRFAVLSAEYRLAPEHPYPAAVEDADAVVRWVAGHATTLGFDPDRLGVGGDSAGGNLATVAARHARDRGEPALAVQLLIYPSTDATCDRPSMHENAEGYVLEAATIRWFRSHYVPDDDGWTDPDVSPLLADDLAGLPPAVVVTAEYDPLRDQGDAYAEALAASGVEVRHLRYPGLIHTFVQIPSISERSREALEELAREVAIFLKR